VFLFGWLSSLIFSSYINDSVQNNLDNAKTISNNKDLLQFGSLENLFGDHDQENIDKSSPYDWIKPYQISVYNDQVIIKIENPEWSMFTDTKSMDPIIDSTSNAIEIIPKSEDDIHLGDIVAYKSNYKDGTVTHRIIEIGNDAFGWYARLKGDNNDRIDPGKVRFEQIKRVVVAIIY